MVIRIISHSLKYLDLRCLEWVKKGTISESSFCARVGWTEISEINSGNCQYLPISDVFFRDSWGHLQRNGSSSGRSTPAPLLRQAPTSSDKTCHCCQCVVLYMFVQTTWDLTESTMLPQFALCSLLYQMAYKRFSSFSPSVTASNIWK